jgi:hypothetical protein
MFLIILVLALMKKVVVKHKMKMEYSSCII